jgi:uncharacterized circularly permuted ATP-grasp superfamily protein
MPNQPHLDEHPISELYPAYRCPATSYDELISDGQVRPHYQGLLGIQPRLDGGELYLRWQSVKRSLRENPSASTGQLMKTDASRIWELDPIPFVISELNNEFVYWIFLSKMFTEIKNTFGKG